MIQLGKSDDGQLVLGTNEAFPADIKYVEYYRDQRLFSLVFENDENALMPLEIPEDISHMVKKSPYITVLEIFEAPQAPMGYFVPLIQIGI